MWSIGGKNGKPFQYSCHKNPMNSMKKQKDMEDEPPGQKVFNMLLGKSGRQLPEIMKPLGQRGNNAQLWMCPVMKAIQCCKEQYCIGTWNIRPMNQGKLDMVRQEMIRINTDILGISELKWTGKGKFNSDDHYIYYCGQESLRKNGVAFIINKRVQNAILGCNLKNDRMILVHFQGNPFNITVIQVYVQTTNVKEAEVEQFLKIYKNL